MGADADFDAIFANRAYPIRYYVNGTPVLTGDEEYDAASLKCHLCELWCFDQYAGPEVTPACIALVGAVQ